MQISAANLLAAQQTRPAQAPRPRFELPDFEDVLGSGADAPSAPAPAAPAARPAAPAAAGVGSLLDIRV